MEKLKYKLITSEKQYYQYCRAMYDLAFGPGRKTKQVRDEMDLLELLIETYDKEHHQFPDYDPVEMLQLKMREHDLKAVDLAEELGVTKGYISQILNYKKGFSKEIIRKLAKKFRVQQEAFNRPYPLVGNKKRKAA